MQIATRKIQDVLVIELAGRLDSLAASEVGGRITAIATGADKHVLMNLRALEFVTSAGLRIILRLSRLLQAHGGELKISDPQEMVGTVLATAGFDSLLRIHPTEADALRAFADG